MLDLFDIDKIVTAVKESGKTQQQLAEETGLDQSHISRFLAGKRGLSYFSYVAICKAVGGTAKEYLTEEGKKVLTSELD